VRGEHGAYAGRDGDPEGSDLTFGSGPSEAGSAEGAAVPTTPEKLRMVSVEEEDANTAREVGYAYADELLHRAFESFEFDLPARRRSWRIDMIPGGLRLLAEERIVRASTRDFLGRRERESRDSEDRRSQERLFIVGVLELVLFRVSRLLLLRVAGLKLKQQRTLSAWKA
jgi:hypothetical protein